MKNRTLKFCKKHKHHWASIKMLMKILNDHYNNLNVKLIENAISCRYRSNALERRIGQIPIPILLKPIVVPIFMCTKKGKIYTCEVEVVPGYPYKLKSVRLKLKVCCDRFAVESLFIYLEHVDDSPRGLALRKRARSLR